MQAPGPWLWLSAYIDMSTCPEPSPLILEKDLVVWPVGDDIGLSQESGHTPETFLLDPLSGFVLLYFSMFCSILFRSGLVYLCVYIEARGQD